MYALLTECEVKIHYSSGYWPSFLCLFMDQDEVEVKKKMQKRTRLISSHLDQISFVNKGFH